MIYCHACNWEDEYRVCPLHGYERNPNGTGKSTLSPEEKITVKLIKERYANNSKKVGEAPML